MSHPREPVDHDVDPSTQPVEPDQGPVPPAIPIDPEHERLVDPET